MLLQLREFIAQRRWVSVAEIARAFHIAPDALEPMLAGWEDLGVVTRHEQAGCQRRCSGCHASTAAYYQYVASSGGNSRGPGIA